MQRFVIRFDLGFLSPDRSLHTRLACEPHPLHLNPPSLSLIHLVIVYGHVNVNVFTWRLIHSFYPLPLTPIHSHQQFGRQLAAVSTVKVGRNSFSFFFVRSFFILSFNWVLLVWRFLEGACWLTWSRAPRAFGYASRSPCLWAVTVEFRGRQ
jgi:hypothetical protein